MSIKKIIKKFLLTITVLFLTSASLFAKDDTDYFKLAETGIPSEVQKAFRTNPNLKKQVFGANKETFLMLVLKNDRTDDIVRICLIAGCNVDAKAKDGRTATMFAAEFSSRKETLETIIKAAPSMGKESKKRVEQKDSLGKTSFDYSRQNLKNTSLGEVLDKFGDDPMKNLDKKQAKKLAKKQAKIEAKLKEELAKEQAKIDKEKAKEETEKKAELAKKELKLAKEKAKKEAEEKAKQEELEAKLAKKEAKKAAKEKSKTKEEKLATQDIETENDVQIIETEDFIPPQEIYESQEVVEEESEEVRENLQTQNLIEEQKVLTSIVEIDNEDQNELENQKEDNTQKTMIIDKIEVVNDLSKKDNSKDSKKSNNKKSIKDNAAKINTKKEVTSASDYAKKELNQQNENMITEEEKISKVEKAANIPTNKEIKVKELATEEPVLNSITTQASQNNTDDKKEDLTVQKNEEIIPKNEEKPKQYSYNDSISLENQKNQIKKYTQEFLYDFAEENQNEETEELDYEISDPNQVDKNGVTLLMKACKAGNDWDIKKLLNAGANIHARDKDNWTALMYAVRYQNNKDIVKLLIEKGAYVRVRNKYNATPLLLAANYSQNPEILKLLLANRSASEEEVYNAFIFALTDTKSAEHIQIAKIQLFLDMGITLNRLWKGKTPLIYAAKHGNSTKVLDLLMKNGAKPGIQDTKGKTAFDYAKENIKLNHDNYYWALNSSEK